MHGRTLGRGPVRFVRQEQDPSNVHEAVATAENPFALSSCRAGTLAADRGWQDSLEINSRQTKAVTLVGGVLLRSTWRMKVLWIVRRGGLKMMGVELCEMPLVVGR